MNLPNTETSDTHPPGSVRTRGRQGNVEPSEDSHAPQVAMTDIAKPDAAANDGTPPSGEAPPIGAYASEELTHLVATVVE